MAICFLYVSMSYGCMMFFTSALKGHNLSATQYGVLFSLPYILTMAAMSVAAIVTEDGVHRAPYAESLA